jgi:hypothetical protein
MSDWNQSIPSCQDKTELSQRLSDILGVGYFYIFTVKDNNNKLKTIHGVNELVKYILQNENEIEIVDKLLSSNKGSFVLKIISHKQYEMFN